MLTWLVPEPPWATPLGQWKTDNMSPTASGDLCSQNDEQLMETNKDQSSSTDALITFLENKASTTTWQECLATVQIWLRYGPQSFKNRKHGLQTAENLYEVSPEQGDSATGGGACS